VNAAVRVMLLSEVLDCIRECGWGADAEAGQAADKLKALVAGQVRWFDPEDAKAAAKVKECQAALDDPVAGLGLKGVKGLADLADTVTARREVLLTRLRLAVLGHGVLLRASPAEKGQWTIRLNPAGRAALKAGNELVVVQTGPAGEKTFHLIGRIAASGQGLQVELAQAPGVPEGSMVFVCDAAPPPPRPANPRPGRPIRNRQPPPHSPCPRQPRCPRPRRWPRHPPGRGLPHPPPARPSRSPPIRPASRAGHESQSSTSS